MKTLAQAVIDLREKHFAIALELLRTTNLTIEEISAASGVSLRSVGTLTARYGITRARTHKSPKNICTDTKSAVLEESTAKENTN